MVAESTTDEELETPRSRRASTKAATNKSNRRRNKEKDRRKALCALLAYECTAEEYDYACAFMAARRFRGNSRGGRTRRAISTHTT